MTWGYASLISLCVALAVWAVANLFKRSTYEALTTSVVAGFSVFAFCASQIPPSVAAGNAHTPPARSESGAHAVAGYRTGQAPVAQSSSVLSSTEVSS